MELADRIVVMRAGRVVATMNVSDVTEEQLLGLMVGSAAAV
jgi:ABC-type sugar transport system ATPase subunit